MFNSLMPSLNIRSLPFVVFMGGFPSRLRSYQAGRPLVFLYICNCICGYGSLHSSVTSQPKTIGHFTSYPKQIEFDFGHFTAYYLLVGTCCPRGFWFMLWIWFLSSRYNKKYIIESTDLLISCHVRNNNYALCQVWIFLNKIANITCAYINENLLQKPINQITQTSLSINSLTSIIPWKFTIV